MDFKQVQRAGSTTPSNKGHLPRILPALRPLDTSNAVPIRNPPRDAAAARLRDSSNNSEYNKETVRKKISSIVLELRRESGAARAVLPEEEAKRLEISAKNVLGRNLQRLRKSKGLTQRALGKAIGKPASYIGSMENGRTGSHLYLLDRVAKTLGVETHALFLEEGSKAETMPACNV